jgi:hypothetical protein
VEGGSGTRRRPIGRDYAAAKDAEWGMRNKGGMKSTLEGENRRRVEGRREK